MPVVKCHRLEACTNKQCKANFEFKSSADLISSTRLFNCDLAAILNFCPFMNQLCKDKTIPVRFWHSKPAEGVTAAAPMQDSSKGYCQQLSGHPQIVRLDAAEVTASGAFILIEHCPSDVLALMNQTLPGHLDEQTILHIFTDTCKAVAHMHYQQQPLLHRDLKVENILIGADGYYKLCDFGSATSNTVAPNARLPREQIVQMDEEIQAMTTLEYRAPEMIDLYLRRGVTEKADIWALGVLLYKLCYFRTPFDNASPLTILNAEYSIPDKPIYSKQLRHVFQMTLREEPRERSTIYTLCTYLCGLRGEVCLLENKYATPPASPSDSLASSKGGLGYVSAQPPAPAPRRYAASSAKFNQGSAAGSDAYASDSISELDSGSIVPMRRGRPVRQAAQATASSSASPGNSRASSPVPRKQLGFPSRFSSTLSQASRSVSETASSRSPPVTAVMRDNNALGIFDSNGSIKSNALDDYVGAADPVPVSSSGPPSSSSTRDMQRLRMSVKAPDGRESLSVDFVQGAVFGSARRTSVLRRNPSVASNISGSDRRTNAKTEFFGGSTDGTDDTLSSPAVGLSRKSTNSSMSYVSRTVSMGEYADEPASVDNRGLPGFVSQPLPPPPPSQSLSSLLLQQPQTPQSAPMQSFAEPRNRALDGSDASAKNDPTLLANMISPLSLVHSSPTEPDFAAHAVNNSRLDDPWSVSKTTDDPALLRLSTILESSQPADRKSLIIDAADQRTANSKALYEVTLDKLEDDARYSMVFDNQLLFNAKAQYAAQRSSVYQSPQNYFDEKSMADEAYKQWEGIAPETMGALMRKMDNFNNANSDVSQENNSRRAMDTTHDAWSIAAVVPRPTTAMRPVGEDSSSVDFDTVLRRAEQRNRRKLIAQNNRRSQYIFGAGNGSTGKLPEVLQEDVEDGMRVLSKQEIEELLQKMDMYNRELLSEQEKWGALSNNVNREAANNKEGDNGVDLQSIEGIIERANDELLRSEQKSGNVSGIARENAKDTDSKVSSSNRPMAVGILQNVLSVAKSTFAKSLEDPAASNNEENDIFVPDKPPRAVAQQAAVDVASKPESNSADGNQNKDGTNEVNGFIDTNNDDGDDSKISSSRKSQSAMADSCAVVDAQKKASTEKTETATIANSGAARPTTAPLQSTTAPKAEAANLPVPKLPAMGRTQTDTAALPSSAVSDPLAEARMRLKKKQSTPLMRTTATASSPLSPAGGSLPVSSARVAFLGTLEAKNPLASLSPKLPGGGPPAKKPAKSVRNLVAMFEQS
ncbi:Ark- serine/threonine protein kinase [Coemansia asiatica]|nr:Ark- serine/threonine protein kinase [Coemansia asiatica]